MTFDKRILSDPKSSEPITASRADVAQLDPLLDPVADVCTDEVARYVRESLSENTRRAYRSDLAHFKAWGGSIPSTPEQIAGYLGNAAVHAATTAMLYLRYLRRPAALKIVSFETLGRSLCLSHSPMRLHKRLLGLRNWVGTPSGYTAAMAR